ncbi:Hypothetical protein GLP15_3789 [Giardia lamblia P15]|uniref:Uncharacterized protein n=1 Tax=Giardia intestinalis (strain P15) TaxID=658858 RepID=E1F240_GIAIA|nr:Hypothetical protein GLP15_3789 [Giardia lamblia P15]
MWFFFLAVLLYAAQINISDYWAWSQKLDNFLYDAWNAFPYVDIIASLTNRDFIYDPPISLFPIYHQVGYLFLPKTTPFSKAIAVFRAIDALSLSSNQMPPKFKSDRQYDLLDALRKFLDKFDPNKSDYQLANLQHVNLVSDVFTAISNMSYDSISSAYRISRTTCDGVLANAYNIVPESIDDPTALPELCNLLEFDNKKCLFLMLKSVEDKGIGHNSILLAKLYADHVRPLFSSLKIDSLASGDVYRPEFLKIYNDLIMDHGVPYDLKEVLIELACTYLLQAKLITTSISDCTAFIGSIVIMDNTPFSISYRLRDLIVIALSYKHLCGRRRVTYFHDSNSVHALKLESGLLVPLDVSQPPTNPIQQLTIDDIITSSSTALASRYIKRDIVFLVHPSKLRTQSPKELQHYVNNIVRHQLAIITSMCTIMDRIWIYVYNPETQKYDIPSFTKLQGDARLKTQYPGAPFFGGYSTNDTEYPYKGSLNSYYQIYRYYSNQDLNYRTFSVAKNPYYNTKAAILNNKEAYKEYILNTFLSNTQDSFSSWDSAFGRYARPSKSLFSQRAVHAEMVTHMTSLLTELVSGVYNNYYACDSECDISDESRAFASMQYQNIYVFSYSDSNFYDIMQVSTRSFKTLKTSRLHFFPVLVTACSILTDFDVDYPLAYNMSFFMKRLLKISCDELSYIDSLAMARNTRKGILQASNWFSAVLNGATLFLYSDLSDAELRRQLLPLFTYIANYEGKRLFADNVPSLVIYKEHSYMGYNLPVVAQTNPCYLKYDGFLPQSDKALAKCNRDNLLSHLWPSSQHTTYSTRAGSNPLFTYRGSLIHKINVSGIHFSPLSLDYDALSYMRIYHQDNNTRRYFLDPYSQVLLFENIGLETYVNDPLADNSTDSYHLYKHSFLTEVLGLRSIMTVNNKLQYVPQSVYIYAGAVNKFIRRQVGIFGYIRVGIPDESNNSIGFDMRISETTFAYRRYRVPQGQACTLEEIKKMYTPSTSRLPLSYAQVSNPVNKLLLSPPHSVLETDCMPFNGTKVCFQSRAFDQYINVTKFSNKIALVYLENIVKKASVTTRTSLGTECVPTLATLKTYFEDRTLFPDLKSEYKYPSNIFVPAYIIFLEEFEKLKKLLTSILDTPDLTALLTIFKFRDILEKTINSYLSGAFDYDTILKILDNFTVTSFYPDSSVNMDNSEMIVNYTAVLNDPGSYLTMKNLLRIYPDYNIPSDSSLPFRKGCYLADDLLGSILSDSNIMSQEFSTCSYANHTSAYVNLSSQMDYVTTKLYCLERPKYFLDPTTEVVSWIAPTSVGFKPANIPTPIKNFGLYSPLLTSYLLTILPEAFRTRRFDGVFHLSINQHKLPDTLAPNSLYFDDFDDSPLEHRSLYGDSTEHHNQASFHDYDDVDSSDSFSEEDIEQRIYASAKAPPGTIQRVYYTGIYENDLKNIYIDIQTINRDILRYAMHVDKHPLVNIMNSLSLPIFMRIYPPFDESAEFITKPRPLDPTNSDSPSTCDYLLKILSYQLNTMTSSLTGKLHPNFMYNPLNLAESEDWDYGYQPLQNYVQGNPIDEYSYLLYFASFPIYASPQSRIDNSTKALAGVYTVEYNISISILDSMHNFGVLSSKILPSSTSAPTLVDLRIPVFYALLNNMGDFVLSRSTNATLSSMKSVLSSILDTLVDIEYFVVRKVPVSNERYTNVLEYNNQFWIDIQYKDTKQLITARRFNIIMVTDGVATQLFSSEAGIDSVAYEQSSISDRLIVLDLASTCIKRGVAIIRNLVTVDLMSIAVFNIEYYPVKACTRVPGANAYTDKISRFSTSIYSHLNIEEDPTIWKPSITYMTGYPPDAHMRLLLQLFGQAMHTYISSAETLLIVVISVFTLVGAIVLKIYCTVVSKRDLFSISLCRMRYAHSTSTKICLTHPYAEDTTSGPEPEISCTSLTCQNTCESSPISRTKSSAFLPQKENQVKEKVIELQSESSTTAHSDTANITWSPWSHADATYDSGILGRHSVTGLLNFLRRPLRRASTFLVSSSRRLSLGSALSKKQLALSRYKSHKHTTPDINVMADDSPLVTDSQPLLNPGTMTSITTIGTSISASSYLNTSDIGCVTSKSPTIKRVPHNWLSKILSNGVYFTFTSLFTIFQSSRPSQRSPTGQAISLSEHELLSHSVSARKLRHWKKAFDFLKSALESKAIRLKENINPFNLYQLKTIYKMNILLVLQQLYPSYLKKMRIESQSNSKLLSTSIFSEKNQESSSLALSMKQLTRLSSQMLDNVSLFKVIFTQLASRNFATKLPDVKTGLSLLSTVQLLVDPTTTNLQFSESSSETFSSTEQSVFSFSSSAISFQSTIEAVRVFPKHRQYRDRLTRRCTGYISNLVRSTISLQSCTNTKGFDNMDEASSDLDRHSCDFQSSSITNEYSVETDMYLPYYTRRYSTHNKLGANSLFKGTMKQRCEYINNFSLKEAVEEMTKDSPPIIRGTVAQQTAFSCIRNVSAGRDILFIRKSMSESNLSQLENRFNPFIPQSFKKTVLTSCLDTECYQFVNTISKKGCIKDTILNGYLDNLNASLIEAFDNPFKYKKLLDYGYEYHGIVRYADPLLNQISPEYINISNKPHILRTNPKTTIIGASQLFASVMKSSMSPHTGLIHQTTRSLSPQLALKTLNSYTLYKHESHPSMDLRINPLIPSIVRWTSGVPYIPPYTIFAKENFSFTAAKLRAKYARKLMNYNTAFSTMLKKEGIEDVPPFFIPIKDRDIHRLINSIKLQTISSAPLDLEDISEDNKLFEEITYRKLGILQKRSTNYRANVIAKYLFYRECDFNAYYRFYSPRVKRTVSHLFWRYHLRTQMQLLSITPSFPCIVKRSREGQVEQAVLSDIFLSPKLGYLQGSSPIPITTKRYITALSNAFYRVEPSVTETRLSKMSLIAAAIKEIKSMSTGVLFAEDSVCLHHILVVRALYTKKIAECFYTPLSVVSLAGLALPQSAYTALSSDVTIQFPVYALLERFYSSIIVPELSIWNLKETGAETFSVCDSAAYGQFMIARKRAQVRTSVMYALLDRNLFYKTQPEYAIRKSFSDHSDAESSLENSLEPEANIIIPRIIKGLLEDSDDKNNDLNHGEQQYDYYLSSSSGYKIDIDDLFNYTSSAGNTELLPILPPQGIDAPQSLGILPPQGIDAPQSLGILPPQGIDAPQISGSPRSLIFQDKNLAAYPITPNLDCIAITNSKLNNSLTSSMVRDSTLVTPITEIDQTSTDGLKIASRFCVYDSKQVTYQRISMSLGTELSTDFLIEVIPGKDTLLLNRIETGCIPPPEDIEIAIPDIRHKLRLKTNYDSYLSGSILVSRTLLRYQIPWLMRKDKKKPREAHPATTNSPLTLCFISKWKDKASPTDNFRSMQANLNHNDTTQSSTPSFYETNSGTNTITPISLDFPAQRVMDAMNSKQKQDSTTSVNTLPTSSDDMQNETVAAIRQSVSVCPGLQYMYNLSYPQPWNPTPSTATTATTFLKSFSSEPTDFDATPVVALVLNLYKFRKSCLQLRSFFSDNPLITDANEQRTYILSADHSSPRIPIKVNDLICHNPIELAIHNIRLSLTTLNFLYMKAMYLEFGSALFSRTIANMTIDDVLRNGLESIYKSLPWYNPKINIQETKNNMAAHAPITLDCHKTGMPPWLPSPDLTTKQHIQLLYNFFIRQNNLAFAPLMHNFVVWNEWGLNYNDNGYVRVDFRGVHTNTIRDFMLQLVCLEPYY